MVPLEMDSTLLLNHLLNDSLDQGGRFHSLSFHFKRLQERLSKVLKPGLLIIVHRTQRLALLHILTNLFVENNSHARINLGIERFTPGSQSHGAFTDGLRVHAGNPACLPRTNRRLMSRLRKQGSELSLLRNEGGLAEITSLL